MLKKRFKEYFNFSKKERNGTIVLLFILCALIGINIWIKNKEFGEIILMSEEFQQEIDRFEASLKPIKQNQIKAPYQSEPDNKNLKINYFRFDPNSVTKSELTQLGFNSKQINTLLNYRNKGGSFSNKEDLLKIYGVNKELYNKLEPYIEIQDNKDELIVKDENIERIGNNISVRLEMNSASMKELMELPGIGESFANKIIKYRQLLGGFHHKDQLLEVYGMDSARFFKIDSLIYFDTLLISKLNINKVQYKTLLRHPYLNKYQTNAIMKYRELAGKFHNVNQLFEYNLLEEEDYFRIKPYLTTDTLK